jgi:hypothetical protein
VNAFGSITFAAAIIAVVCALNKGFVYGLGFGTALLVALPHMLRVPAGFFELTIQRVIIILIFLQWLRLPKGERTERPAALLPSLVCVGLCQFVSMVQSPSVADSLKSLISFGIETCLFYVIVATSVKDIRAGLWLIRCACMGIAAAAVAAWLQKYAGFDVRAFLGASTSPEMQRDILGSFPHRIMLGYAMAMTIPLLVGLLAATESKPETRRYGVALVVIIAACYFSMSRGPWLATGLVAIGLAWLGTSRPRRVIVMAGVAVLVVVIVRPGVWDTIYDLNAETFQGDTLKGKSYEYRWVLWRVAVGEITKSVPRTLFGYGGMSHEGMDLSGYFGKQHGGNVATLGFTSFDNNYAADLLEFGLVGFMAEMVVYFKIARRLYANWRAAEPGLRDMTTATFAACAVFLFANSNVYIFSPQLRCLFWALVAVGTSTVWIEGQAGGAGQLQSAPETQSGQDREGKVSISSNPLAE